MTKYTHSDIDKLFFQMFRYYPSKEGQSYELIVGAVLKILNPEKKVVWDEKKEGAYDKNSYQIDVSLYEVNSESIMVEAKDHTKIKDKVNRSELDKVAGSLIEINSKAGYVFSATDFTKDAKRKSIGSKINPNAKEISLFHLRPSTSDDDKGRLKQIEIRLVIHRIIPEKTTLNPTLPDSVIKSFEENKLETKFSASVDFDYQDTYVDCKGDLFGTNGNLIGNFEFYKTLSMYLFDEAKETDYTTQGRWKVDTGVFRIHGLEIPIEFVNYSFSFDNHTETLIIKTTGNPILFVKTEDNSINTLITDYQMKGITFHDNGEIEFDGRNK